MMANTKTYFMSRIARQLGKVMREGERIFDKRGEQQLSLFEWLSILTEEVGEFAQAINDARWDNPAKTFENAREQRIHMREEITQVAAVAVLIREALDKGPESYPDLNHEEE